MLLLYTYIFIKFCTSLRMFKMNTRYFIVSVSFPKNKNAYLSLCRSFRVVCVAKSMIESDQLNKKI